MRLDPCETPLSDSVYLSITSLSPGIICSGRPVYTTVANSIVPNIGRMKMEPLAASIIHGLFVDFDAPMCPAAAPQSLFLGRWHTRHGEI